MRHSQRLPFGMPGNRLPLLNLSKPITPALAIELKTALRQFGAFRLAVPENTRYHHGNVIQNASWISLPSTTVCC